MEQKSVVTIGMDMAHFEGVFANMFVISSSGQEARLDCVYVDRSAINPDTGDMSAKVVARVNMTAQSMVELRDILDRHIKDNFVEVQKDAE